MDTITQAVQAAIQQTFGVELTPSLARPEEKFGDFATNVAMQLAGTLGKPPREIAEELAVALRTDPLFEKVEIAGPGFINLTLTDSSLLEQLKQVVRPYYAGKKFVIETNNPNPFKDIHIGHAMNAIVADTIANLLDAGGAEVHRVSYHGDVGLHVAKSLWAIRDEFEADLATKLAIIPEADRPRRLREWYARGAGLYEEDPSIKLQIDALIPYTFSNLNDDLWAAYELCKAWSFSYFDTVFTSLGSKPIERRYLESQADREGRAIVEGALGTVFTKSDGAIIFAGEQYGLHTRVFIASRGTSLYEARDLGLMVLKDADFAADMSYIVTAEEQKEYFKVVFKAAELANPRLAGKTTNISTGTVKLTTGKMSSRTGNVVNISWLFDTLREAVVARGAEAAAVEQTVRAALRYTMLKNRLSSDTVFDVAESVALEGNTGPYLQYAHARARSILAKNVGEISRPTQLDAAERSLVRTLAEYPEAVDRAVQELMPHHICTYLYELAQAFNRFYEHSRVIDDPRQAARVWLVTQYADTLMAGLTILGIIAPDRM